MKKSTEVWIKLNLSNSQDYLKIPVDKTNYFNYFINRDIGKENIHEIKNFAFYDDGSIPVIGGPGPNNFYQDRSRDSGYFFEDYAKEETPLEEIDDDCDDDYDDEPSEFSLIQLWVAKVLFENGSSPDKVNAIQLYCDDSEGYIQGEGSHWGNDPEYASSYSLCRAYLIAETDDCDFLMSVDTDYYDCGDYGLEYAELVSKFE